MILEAIESQARTDLTEEMALPPGLTVEHVMPQRWATTWPRPKATPGDERTHQERVAARYDALHTVGNLTLVTGKLNPSMSNGSWPKKRSALRTHSALTLNREIAEADERTRRRSPREPNWFFRQPSHWVLEVPSRGGRWKGPPERSPQR